MKTLSLGVLMALICCACFGCRNILSEPYPASVLRPTTLDKLPSEVVQSFSKLHPESILMSAETLSFKGHIRRFRLTFRTTNGPANTQVFTPEGEVDSSPGTFPPSEVNPTREP
jgi:hypothetical protein